MTRAASAVGAGEMILDIGPESAKAVAAIVAKAGTLIWNGPLGVFEFDQFGEGTRSLAAAIAGSPAFSIAGGGDTLAAIEKYGVEDDISYISTGGGAFLEFVEGRTLPAVAALERRAADGAGAVAGVQMTRRTKIVATLGPATDPEPAMRDLMEAGTDLVRVNFSHGGFDEHARRIELARAAAARAGRVVGILGDLRGPKVRIERFATGSASLIEGEAFTLDPTFDPLNGTDRIVGVAYESLPRDVKPGDTLLLNDGLISLEVTSVEGTKVMSACPDQRRAQRHEGAQQAGRRALGRRTDGKGPRRHPDGGGTRRGLPGGVLRPQP